MKFLKRLVSLRNLLLVLFFSLATINLSLFALLQTSAQGSFGGGGGGGGGAGGGGMTTVFGGQVEDVRECFCRDVITSGKWIKVGDPSPGEFFISHFYSEKYDNEPVNNNEWVLGSSFPISMECKIDTVIYGCVKIEEGDLVRKIGSSGQ